MTPDSYPGAIVGSSPATVAGALAARQFRVKPRTAEDVDGTGPVRGLLEPAVWRELEREHREQVDALTADRRQRADGHRPHPVEDFLFTYYALSPAQLRRWHPGAQVGLIAAGERADWRFHRTLGPAGPDGPTVAADPVRFLAARGRSVAFIRNLLRTTSSATPQFGCFGLHEWAMVFESDQRRHLDWPLRLGQDATDDVVRTHQIRCSHFDAFRFFTPTAAPRNLLMPNLWSRDRMEQPGCLHASMDLYKWAYRLAPMLSSALLLDCFRLARDIRAIDMRASPYDLTDLGYAPITIETPAGKAEYVTAQREFSERGQQLRRRLIRELDVAFAGMEIPDPGTEPKRAD